MSIDDFHRRLFEEINTAKQNDFLFFRNEDFFTSTIFSYLNDFGETDDPVLLSFRDQGVQVNGYEFKDGHSKLFLYVSYFYEYDAIIKTSKTEVTAALNRAQTFFTKSINQLFSRFEKDSDAYGLAQLIFKKQSLIKVLNLVFLTNGSVKEIDHKCENINAIEVKIAIWDIERLFKVSNSGKNRESININFIERFNQPVYAVYQNPSDKYQVFLALLKGKWLADLYKEFGTRLLERNVRSFLSLKGKINKGIRETILENPEMFLAFNNGITITAEKVDWEKEPFRGETIKALYDVQIVNGGQTTASLYHAMNELSANVDFSTIVVQAKIIVINNQVDMDEIVPQISLYSNSQNAIKNSDFSSNHPFHRKLEEYSRTIFTPPFEGRLPRKWFFERARGQYSDALGRENTTFKKQVFKTTNPLITKTEVAKIMVCFNGRPDIVSMGSEKCYLFFMEGILRLNFIPSKSYYENLISKTIIFREAARVIRGQKYGGYNVNILAFTVSWIGHLTKGLLDYSKIWREQKITLTLENEIVKISRLVRAHLLDAPVGVNIAEYAKKLSTWESLLRTPYILSDELNSELLEKMAEEEKNVTDELSAEDAEKVSNVNKIDAKNWFQISKWAKENGLFEPYERSILFSIGLLRSKGKSISIKQARIGLKLFEEAQAKGFNAT